MQGRGPALQPRTQPINDDDESTSAAVCMLVDDAGKGSERRARSVGGLRARWTSWFDSVRMRGQGGCAFRGPYTRLHGARFEIAWLWRGNSFACVGRMCFLFLVLCCAVLVIAGPHRLS